MCDVCCKLDNKAVLWKINPIFIAFIKKISACDDVQAIKI